MDHKKQKFVEMAAPEYWYSYAHELADTADQIFETSKQEWVGYFYRDIDGSEQVTRRPLVSRPVLLLYGFALENLIKGLLISEDPKLLEKGDLPNFLLKHNLKALATRLKSFIVTNDEIDVLALLSDVIPYYGRYPVPRIANDVKAEEFISQDIYDTCKALFERLEMQLYRLNYHGLVAPFGVHFAKLRLPHLDSKADFINGNLPQEWREFPWHTKQF